jgi:hypothetical protein
MINLMLKIQMSQQLVNKGFTWDGTFEEGPDGFKANGKIPHVDKVWTEEASMVEAVATFDSNGLLLSIVEIE